MSQLPDAPISPPPARRGDRIGIGVRTRALRVVLVRRGAVVHSELVEFDGRYPSASDYSRAISAVASNAGARRRLFSPSIHLAVGPAHCQLRRLASIPTLRDAVAMNAMVQQNVASLFLKNGVPLRVGRHGAADERGAWVTAFDEPVIQSAVIAAEELGIHDVTAIPLSAAITPEDEGDSTVRWADGAMVLETRFVGARIDEVTRTFKPGPANEQHPGDTLVDAVGAVEHRRNALRWSTPNRRHLWLRRARLSAAVAMLMVALVALLIGPTVRDISTAHRNEAAIAAVRADVRTATQVEDVLRRRITRLEMLNDFSRRRVRAMEVLAALTSTLPDSTAVAALRLDSLSASATLVGRDVMGAVGELQADDEFTSVEIVGPMTRETTGPMELERVMLKLTLAHPPAMVRTSKGAQKALASPGQVGR